MSIIEYWLWLFLLCLSVIPISTARACLYQPVWFVRRSIGLFVCVYHSHFSLSLLSCVPKFSASVVSFIARGSARHPTSTLPDCRHDRLGNGVHADWNWEKALFTLSGDLVSDLSGWGDNVHANCTVYVSILIRTQLPFQITIIIPWDPSPIYVVSSRSGVIQRYDYSLD